MLRCLLAVVAVVAGQRVGLALRGHADQVLDAFALVGIRLCPLDIQSRRMSRMPWSRSRVRASMRVVGGSSSPFQVNCNGKS